MTGHSSNPVNFTCNILTVILQLTRDGWFHFSLVPPLDLGKNLSVRRNSILRDGRFLPPQYQSIKPIQPHLFFIYHWTPEGRVVDPYMVALYGRKFTLKTVVIMHPSYL